MNILIGKKKKKKETLQKQYECTNSLNIRVLHTNIMVNEYFYF